MYKIILHVYVYMYIYLINGFFFSFCNGCLHSVFGIYWLYEKQGGSIISFLQAPSVIPVANSSAELYKQIYKYMCGNLVIREAVIESLCGFNKLALYFQKLLEAFPAKLCVLKW